MGFNSGFKGLNGLIRLAERRILVVVFTLVSLKFDYFEGGCYCFLKTGFCACAITFERQSACSDHWAVKG